MKLGGFAIWLAVLALAGCGSTPERAPAISPTIIKPHTAEPRATPTNTPDARCVPVSAAMLQTIAAGAKEPITPASGVAVKSDDHKNLYMIAVSFTETPGTSPTIGVWASQSTEPGGQIYSVDGTAAIFTTWPKGQGQFKTQIFDDGVRVAIGCVSG